MDKENAITLNKIKTVNESGKMEATCSGKDTNQVDDQDKAEEELDLVYSIDDTPPWYVSITLGFQHYMTMIGGTLSQPFILSGPMCFSNNPLVIAEVLSTLFFVSGIATFLQSTFGVRLPIVQGGTFSFFAPIFAILSLPKWKCPALQGSSNATMNSSLFDEQEVWQMRMREIQGAIMVSSVFQIVIGFSGVVGFLMRFIGPITIAPTVALIGLALFHVAADHAGNHWGVSMMTLVLIIVFSQFLSNYNLPVPFYSKSSGFHLRKLPVFKLFPIILAIAVSWAICAIVTVAGGFPSDPKNPNYLARTDSRTIVLQKAEWFRFPYPGQWGLPTVSAAGVFGMLAGVLASIVESIGDYYACAKLSGAPPPPKHALNRGIGVEGIGCLLAGMFGTGTGTTSYSENIGAIGITKVGSLRVIQYGGLLMIVVGVLGKIGALFTTIPDPIVGGMFFAMFGMIASVGLSSLQYANMNSPRNIFIVGLALLMGLGLPYWMNKHPGAIKIGVDELDQIIAVLLKTSMAVGGTVALILDNVIPGTAKERGLLMWKSQAEDDKQTNSKVASIHVYDLPFGLNSFSKMKCSKFVPFLPYYTSRANRVDGVVNEVASTSDNKSC